MRKPIVAGQFYPADKAMLRRQIDSFLDKRLKTDSSVLGAIVPHAGYDFSGKCAGKVYSVLPVVDTYIIIGTNHTGVGGNVAVSLEDFETSLGMVRNDTKLGKEILKNLNQEHSHEDEQAHEYEHSIEVQLPFLQETQEKNKNFKIVPVISREHNYEQCKKLANAVFQASKKLKRNIVALASSDFTHSGPNYGSIIDMKIDKQAIDNILKLDSKGFLSVSEKTTICGAGSVCSVIEISKLLGAKKAKLLEYYDSSAIIPGENKVGYASIVFY